MEHAPNPQLQILMLVTLPALSPGKGADLETLSLEKAPTLLCADLTCFCLAVLRASRALLPW